MRSLDPERTPQELQPARVPSVLMFSVGILIWLAVLLVLGARHLLGYGADGRLVSLAVAGVVLGTAGLVWAWVRPRPEFAAPTTEPAPDPQDPS
ncbi:hypothetical protein ACO0LV_07960 [Pseudactinotalea sp. Z1739]|uniref:hypothetical protein n=1 Tax=Pseudactinotalea sp. Z1739 TaxID=3413028 RepID=UPI003C7E3560